MSYLLDADVFIRAKNQHYGFDFCPAFWKWLIEQNMSGRVYSIEKVGGQLLAGEDELVDWASERGGDFFLPPDAITLPAMNEVSAWAVGQNYDQSAVSTFFQDVDYCLVSHAYAGRHIVVTHEIRSNSTGKIKIPDACIGLGITCVSPYEMLRNERARFVLGRGC